MLGRNGNGKSTLAKGIAGKLVQFSGEVSFSSKLKIGYFAQHQLDELEPELNAIEHLLEIDPEATLVEVKKQIRWRWFGSGKANYQDKTFIRWREGATYFGDNHLQRSACAYFG